MKPNEILADEKTFRAIAAGDLQAYKRYCDLSFEVLRMVANRFARNEALGALVMESFYEQLWEERNELADIADPADYAMSKVCQLAMKALREARRLNMMIEDADSPEAKARQEVVERIERKVKAAGARLSANHREILDMGWRQEYSYQQIAVIKGMKLETVKRYYRQAVRIIESEPDTPE
ncbi:RNA polymerase sigma factor (sigma-70 family) [Filimonas zeae]|uniref:RNA polymerase sigma-70 region 4 domain-containing protein n=1 Tax=Filimonas zeae TaxID=1737353 RepID=A0A917MYD7_9BACT|nr:sigma-70 family RNA polymerase sigma factor [Filimonas zeae]MDR6342076.1 RNA polymerase sigma factor (sigma-70 family) [Filimonas zeae]GGH79202.1 hypothetical protein GCM10011379_48210 [Filimonas zeae]